MRSINNPALGRLLSWVAAFVATCVGTFLLAPAHETKKETDDEQDVPACPDGRHTWSVWPSGFRPDEYYYRCNRCGWVALRDEVEGD